MVLICQNERGQNNFVCKVANFYCSQIKGFYSTTWMKTIQGDLCSLDLELHEARELAQNRPLLRLMSLYSVTHS